MGGCQWRLAPKVHRVLSPPLPFVWMTEAPWKEHFGAHLFHLWHRPLCCWRMDERRRAYKSTSCFQEAPLCFFFFPPSSQDLMSVVCGREVVFFSIACFRRGGVERRRLTSEPDGKMKEANFGLEMSNEKSAKLGRNQIHETWDAFFSFSLWMSNIMAWRIQI